MSPLHLACRHENIAMVDILLQIDVKNLYSTSKEGHSPIHEVFQNNNRALAEKLLQYIPNKEIFQMLDQRTNVGLTPIHVACFEGNNDVLKCVLQSIEEENVRMKLMSARDKTDNVPLHLACKNGNVGITIDLIENKSDVLATNVYGHTPLHVAACYGYTKITRILKQKMRSIDVTDKFKQTPLHRAAKYNQTETIIFLTVRYVSHIAV